MKSSNYVKKAISEKGNRMKLKNIITCCINFIVSLALILIFYLAYFWYQSFSYLTIPKEEILLNGLSSAISEIEFKCPSMVYFQICIHSKNIADKKIKGCIEIVTIDGIVIYKEEMLPHQSEKNIMGYQDDIISIGHFGTYLMEFFNSKKYSFLIILKPEETYRLKFTLDTSSIDNINDIKLSIRGYTYKKYVQDRCQAPAKQDWDQDSRY